MGLRVLILILTIFIIFSGCIEENNVTQSNESAYQGSVNAAPENISSTNLSHEAENIPEIEVTSFSSIHIHTNLEKVEGYIFSWDNVPGNESQRLISYIKNDLDIDWADNAQIVKTNDNETIRVFTPKNSLKFTLINNKTEILVAINYVPWYSEKIENENGKICVYRSFEYEDGSNITEKYYAVYNLSITNNGPNNLDFKLNDLHLRDGNQIFNTTIKPESPYSDGNKILSDLESETKIKDATLFPGQTISGSVTFQVDSLYNESFLLMYQETLVPSTSFENSIKALRTAESCNYSEIFGIPLYEDHYYLNWVNRSVFESLDKASSDFLLNYPSNNAPSIYLDYVLKVTPERNITMLGNKETMSSKTHLSNVPLNTLCVDDAGEELITETSSYGTQLVFLNSRMSFSNATIVSISHLHFGSGKSFIYQDLILDDKLNIVAAKHHGGSFNV
ncbi:MAG TPA: hypothetical protein HA262_05705 [Methanosarcina sp.]|nr:hypothetical protein [Methanosarcina sp.]